MKEKEDMTKEQEKEFIRAFLISPTLSYKFYQRTAEEKLVFLSETYGYQKSKELLCMPISKMGIEAYSGMLIDDIANEKTSNELLIASILRKRKKNKEEDEGEGEDAMMTE